MTNEEPLNKTENSSLLDTSLNKFLNAFSLMPVAGYSLRILQNSFKCVLSNDDGAQETTTVEATVAL